MPDYHDQADGLRRMMRKQKLRMISVFNTDTALSEGWLLALAGNMCTQAQRLLLIEASTPIISQTPLDAVPKTMVDAQYRHFKQAIRPHALGFDHVHFFENSPLTSPLSVNLKLPLDGIVKHIATSYDTVMIEIKHTNEDGFTLPEIAQQEIIIQMQRDEPGIKSAYACIKRICQQYSQRSLSLLVTAASHAEGHQYYMRLNQVCQHFLGVNLHFLGAIPAVQPATRAGMSVMQPAPKTTTIASGTTAASLGKHGLLSNPLVAA